MVFGSEQQPWFRWVLGFEESLAHVTEWLRYPEEVPEGNLRRYLEVPWGGTRRYPEEVLGGTLRRYPEILWGDTRRYPEKVTGGTLRRYLEVPWEGTWRYPEEGTRWYPEEVLGDTRCFFGTPLKFFVQNPFKSSGTREILGQLKWGGYRRKQTYPYEAPWATLRMYPEVPLGYTRRYP